jgi:hypothetical protein
MTLEEQRALGTAARNLSNLLLSGGKIDDMNVVLSIREMMTFTLPLFRDGLLPLTAPQATGPMIVVETDGV